MPSIPDRIGGVAAATVLVSATPTFAHGFGQRYDLPLPLTMWVSAAGLTIVISFVVAAMFMREPTTARDYTRIDLLRIPLVRGLASPIVGDTIRALVALIFLLTLVAGLIGVQESVRNLIVPMIWVIWWVGFSFASVLFGNIWPSVNPLRTLFTYGEEFSKSVLRIRHHSSPRPYPEALGYWPAAVFFVGFAWSELIWPENNTPSFLALEIILYSIITWTGMCFYGEDWLEHGDAFTVAFGVLARFAPFEIRTGASPGAEQPSITPKTPAPMSVGGTAAPSSTGGVRNDIGWNLRLPGAGLLADRGVTWSLVVFVLTMLSTVTFDGFLETPLFQNLSDWVHASSPTANLIAALSFGGIDDEATIKTVTLILFPCAFVVVFALASWLMIEVAGQWSIGKVRSPQNPTISDVSRGFVLTLVPIAVAYHFAHYFSLLVDGGQFIIPLASDPFGFDWDLFGTAGYEVNIGIISPYVYWYAALVAIVIGHIIAVYLAHATALRLFPNQKAALASQVPMVVLMAGYTMVSLWILAQPIVGK
jgi:hypothetical protein